MSGPTEPITAACPGCGAVLAEVPGATGPRHPGASRACTELFAETLHGSREEAHTDVRAAALVELADATYAAQHERDPRRLTAALIRLRAHVHDADDAQTATVVDRAGDLPPVTAERPASWTSTPADMAADLDVVDLSALVRSWADAVWADWSPAHDEVAVIVAGSTASA
ncbi:hypothetical protein GB931_08040 [Modestobacter sp. I12A-02628]|uniref:Uncharacterized protein n=1 Tax=Goekera deserti TaxID=2497753 RepID=A0A7K3WF35_9ACTN|nr:DUF5946 family protein [Goekera deserti]MPQ97874.1 hypothetical protein [Goekera deserti]NDI48520.1 hypothetical protein [Goekera deserti]NEL55101.1 hypothetical protein [Goekera deserti]